MNTEIVQLSQIRVNDANPRTITDAKFHKLVNSILSFPKMLNIRPIAVDAFGVALGGNMRYRALSFIADMSIEQIEERLKEIDSYKKKTEGEKQVLIDYWIEWLQTKEVEIVKAENLSEEEKREFIIKDNVGFGDWDWDMLANEWDDISLNDWGLDMHKYHNVNLDNFFDEDNEKKDKEKEGNTIVLEYTEDEYQMVVEAFEKHSGTKEEIVFKLLGL